MAGALNTIRFRNAEAFSGQTGIVDFDNCVVKGVSLITGQMEAEGHELMVDDTTTSQLYKLAKSAGQVPVYLDHGSGIKELNGFIDNFRMDGTKVRGDWNLLKTHDETQVMLERADRQPKTFGLSVAFKGSGVAVAGGKKAARATKLLSADVVPRPAANKDGLFGARDEGSVDINKKVMNREQIGAGADEEPTMGDIMKAIGGISARIDTMEQSHSQLVEELNQSQGGEVADDYNTLVGLTKMTDAELGQRNLTRADVDAAVAEWNASAGEQAGDDPDGAADPNGGGEPAAATAAVGAGAAVGTGAETSAAMSALRKDVIEMKAAFAAEKKQKRDAQENIQFAALENTMISLRERAEKAIELADKVIVENECLRLHIRTGTRPVKAGAEGIRLFSANGEGELHEFQKRVQELIAEKKITNGEAILLASRENSALHMDWIQKGGAQQTLTA